MSASKLFQPIQVGTVTLQHRVVIAPLTRFRSDSKHTHTGLAVEHYAARASVPGTLIINVIAHIASGLNFHILGIWFDDQVSAWKKVSFFLRVLLLRAVFEISYVQGEASVVGVVNGDSGKTIRVSWHALCEGNLVIEVQSAFFFRNPFTNYENSFEVINEPGYIVELVTDADVVVLISKDWFEWADESKSLTVDARLIFRLRSEVTYKD